MKRVVTLFAAMAAVGMCCSGSASAAGTYTLCSTGPGKPVVSPGTSGKCAPGQTTMTLASSAALNSLSKQVKSLQAKLAGVSRVGSTLRFAGMNLQIVNGLGATNGDPYNPGLSHGRVNGLGNLIIGYNEHPGRRQNGSHNLIVGNYQTFTSFGGIIAGQGNELSGPFAAVLGENNVARGHSSSVTGGISNNASGEYASISGGYSNRASRYASAVSGGVGNAADGFGSSVSGGNGNAAGGLGQGSSVSGGNGNVATGDDASVSGGFSNWATNTGASVLGGCKNVAGGGQLVGTCPAGAGWYPSVLGGQFNAASGRGSTERGGQSQTVSGDFAYAP